MYSHFFVRRTILSLHIHCSFGVCMSLGVEEIRNESGGAVLSLNSSLLWVVTLCD